MAHGGISMAPSTTAPGTLHGVRALGWSWRPGVGTCWHTDAGFPPVWVKGAAGAAAWTLAQVLRDCGDVPDVVTDCLNLVLVLATGRERATGATAPLARIWGLIFTALDDEERKRAARERLCWMGAHGAQHNIGVARKSDGSRVTALDWRANRLADALAKRAAAGVRLPRAMLNLLVVGGAAAGYSFAKLGTVTYAANHHEVTIMDQNGEPVTSTRRDVTGKRPAPPGSSGRACAHGGRLQGNTAAAPLARAAVSLEPSAPRERGAAAALVEPGKVRASRAGAAPSGTRKRQREVDAEAAQELAFQCTWRAGRAARVTSGPPSGSAQAKLDTIHARVRAKVARLAA